MNAPFFWRLSLAALLAVACEEPVVETDGGVDGGQVTDPDGGPADAGSDGGVPVDGGPECGDGVIQAPELCDGDCPASCNDAVACTADELTGSAEECDAMCSFTPITACENGDGCCPDGCDVSTDDDCSATCGNGTVEAPETCDGDCPTSCDDSMACTTDTLVGSASSCSAECSFVAITACTDGDGCCPSGCDATTDDDCAPSCGNGVVEAPETCDGDCPSACDDAVACTTDTLVGDASSCDAECSFVAITACTDGDGCCPGGCNATNDDDCSASCGNGVVEAPETCDGDCPSACDDTMACTTDTLVGDASSCDAECSFVAITACTDGDGCCPSGCTAATDGDCTPTTVNLTNFASGVTGADHPYPTSAYGTWYDAADNAFANVAMSTLEGTPGMRIGDGGFANGIYAIFSGAVPATGNYRVEVRMHVVEDPANSNGVRAYQIGVATGAAAVHRPTDPDLDWMTPPTSAVAPLTISGNYAAMTTGDDTALGPITVTTAVFTATAGDDILIGFGTDVTTGGWNVNAGTWGSSHVLVGDVMLVPVP